MTVAKGAAAGLVIDSNNQQEKTLRPTKLYGITRTIMFNVSESVKLATDKIGCRVSCHNAIIDEVTI